MMVAGKVDLEILRAYLQSLSPPKSVEEAKRRRRGGLCWWFTKRRWDEEVRDAVLDLAFVLMVWKWRREEDWIERRDQCLRAIRGVLEPGRRCRTAKPRPLGLRSGEEALRCEAGS